MSKLSRKYRNHFGPISGVFLSGAISLGTAAEARTAGEILVLDRFGGTEGRGALFAVDPVSGERELVSDLGDRNQGPLGAFASGLAQDREGTVLVVDEEAGTAKNGALFRLDLASGARVVVSDFGDLRHGQLGADPKGIVLGPGGTALVSDGSAGSGSAGAVFRVDLASGARTFVSDFGDPAQGPGGDSGLEGIALEPGGTVVVANHRIAKEGIQKEDLGALVRVDPASGRRTVVSDFGDPEQGVLGQFPFNVAVEPAGSILVIDPEGPRKEIMAAITAGSGALWRVDRTTGSRALVSDFGNNLQGTVGERPLGIALESNGKVLVIDPGDPVKEPPLDGVLFRVDPTSGIRTVLSDFGDPAQGPTSQDPVAVAVLRGGDAFPRPTPVDPPPVDPPDAPPPVPPIVPSCFGRIPTIVGDEGDNVLRGSPGPDVIWGGGADLIDGRGGNDRICGGPGRDALKGGKGRDRLDGGPGFDVLIGGTGRDRCRGGERKTNC